MYEELIMAEYIEREAALEVTCHNCTEKNICGGDCYDTDSIRSIPAADVVPVVRCKECKHGTRLVCDLAGNEGVECRHGNIAHRLDWFCADGAKMDTEEQEAVYDPDKFFGRE